MAVAAYHEAKGHYPPPYLADENGRPAHSWRVLLLPYIEQGPLFKEYRFDEPWDGPNNRKLAKRMPQLYAFHGDHHPDNTTTNYLAVVGKETVWRGEPPVSSRHVTDGLATTIMIVENKGANVHWMEPRDLSFDEMSFAVPSPNGVSSKYHDPAVVMLDCASYRLTDITPSALCALMTIDGGEKLRSNYGNGWILLPDGRARDFPGK